VDSWPTATDYWSVNPLVQLAEDEAAESGQKEQENHLYQEDFWEEATPLA
jgi:hypothetical protein